MIPDHILKQTRKKHHHCDVGIVWVCGCACGGHKSTEEGSIWSSKAPTDQNIPSDRRECHTISIKHLIVDQYITSDHFRSLSKLFRSHQMPKLKSWQNRESLYISVECLRSYVELLIHYKARIHIFVVVELYLWPGVMLLLLLLLIFCFAIVTCYLSGDVGVGVLLFCVTC